VSRVFSHAARTEEKAMKHISEALIKAMKTVVKELTARVEAGDEDAKEVLESMLKFLEKLTNPKV
jgi:ribosomal protein S20